jgi:hypothetical protein
VDVGSTADPKIRLVMGKDLPKGSQYLTLSHCWGTYMPMLKDSLHKMIIEIDFEDLPETFQDAVIFARKTDQRFIWIDCLCIIQDDSEDWQTESVQMGEIYKYGYCNLSATHAYNSSYGLFYDRNPTIQPYVKILLKDGSKQVHYYLCERDTWSGGVETAALNRRAWVCQERFLSSRNLHFANNQLFWECKQLSACETFPKGFPTSFMLYSDMKQLMGKPQKATSKGKPLSGASDDSYNTWNLLLETYTSADLTFVQDKLVAISGLAETWATVNNSEYLAGLWRDNIPVELLWHKRFPKDDVPNRQFTAPSWSWASRDGPIVKQRRFEKGVTLFLIDLIDTKIELVGPSQFGQVKSGSLTLKASIAQARCCAIERKSWIFTPPSSKSGGGKVTMKVFWDTSIETIEQENKLKDLKGEPVFLYLLPVLESVYGYQSTEGLVLKRTSEEASEFVRLGKFLAKDSDLVENVRSLCREFDARVEESNLDHRDDGQNGLRYTITLI